MSTSVSRAPRGQQCPSLGAGVGPLLLHLQEPCTFSGGGAFGGGASEAGQTGQSTGSFPIEVFLLPVQLLPRSLSSSMWVSFHNFKRLEILSMGASPIPGHRYLAHFVPSSQTLSLVGFVILFPSAPSFTANVSPRGQMASLSSSVPTPREESEP